MQHQHRHRHSSSRQAHTQRVVKRRGRRTDEPSDELNQSSCRRRRHITSINQSTEVNRWSAGAKRQATRQAQRAHGNRQQYCHQLLSLAAEQHILLKIAAAAAAGTQQRRWEMREAAAAAIISEQQLLKSPAHSSYTQTWQHSTPSLSSFIPSPSLAAHTRRARLVDYFIAERGGSLTAAALRNI